MTYERGKLGLKHMYFALRNEFCAFSNGISSCLRRINHNIERLISAINRHKIF